MFWRPSAARKMPALICKLPGGGGGEERLLDLEAGEIGDGEEDAGAKIGIDYRRSATSTSCALKPVDPYDPPR